MIVTAEEILHSHGILIRRCQQVALAIFTEEAAELDFSPSQYSALALIYAGPGVHQNVLGEQIALDRSSVTKCVEGLENRGFIRREVDPRDKRARLLYITAEGEAMLTDVVAAARRARHRIHQAVGKPEFSKFLDDLKVFSQIMDKPQESKD